MARKQRTYLPNHSYLIQQQGNNLKRCFYCPADYEYYLTQLSMGSYHYQIAIHAYILLENTILLLLTPSSSDGISRLMQTIGSKHVRYMNRKYQRSGTLFQGRHKESVIETQNYLIACMSYIDLFAFQNNSAIHPKNHLWSSYHINTTLPEITSLNSDKHDKIVNSVCLSPHPYFLTMGNNVLSRKTKYKFQLFNLNHSSTFCFITQQLHSCRPIANDAFIKCVKNH